MISETSKNSQNQALEERLSNMHEQMAGVTSRLDQTERDLYHQGRSGAQDA